MQSVWTWLLDKHEFNIAVQARYAIPTLDTELINHRGNRLIYNQREFEKIGQGDFGGQYKKYLVMKTYLDMMFQYPYKETQLEKIGREIFVNHAIDNMGYSNDFLADGIKRETKHRNYFGIEVPENICEEGSISVIDYLKKGKLGEMYSNLQDFMQKNKKELEDKNPNEIKTEAKKREKKIKDLEDKIEKASNAEKGEEPKNVGKQEGKEGQGEKQEGEGNADGNKHGEQECDNSESGESSEGLQEQSNANEKNKASDEKKDDIDKERKEKGQDSKKVSRLCGEHGPTDEVRKYQKLETAKISKGIWIHFIHSVIYAIGQAKYGKSYARSCRWLPKDSKMKLPGRSRSRKAADMRLYVDVSGSMSGVIEQILGMVDQLKIELRKSANIIIKYFDDYLYDDYDKSHGSGTDFDIIFFDARKHFIDGALVVITDGESSWTEWDKYNDDGNKTYAIGINATIPYRANRVCFRIDVEEDRSARNSSLNSSIMRMIANL